MRLSPAAAKFGIYIQFAALIRCLAEYFRLKHILGATLTFSRVEPFLIGALVTSCCLLLAVSIYFFEKHLAAVVVSAANVAILLVLKFILL